MIVGSSSPRIVGQRYEGCIVDDAYQRHYNTPYLVLRESTRQEWEAQQRANLASDYAEAGIKNAPDRAWFYEISVD